MDFPIFDLIEGLSPWWWIAFAVGLAALEMATMSFFLLWPAIAAVLMAVLLVFAPGLSGEAQIVVFAILSVLLTATLRPFAGAWGEGGPAAKLNTRSARMVGRRGTILSVEPGGEARVEIDGVHWRVAAASDTLSPGTPVEVTGADGLILTIRKPQDG